MFTVDENLLPVALQYVLGNQPVAMAEKDPELFKILTAAGIAQLKDGEIRIFNSRNMLENSGSIFLTEDQVTKWFGLDFTMNFELRGRDDKLPVIVEKLAGDYYATVADKDGNHIFGAVVCIQDTRSPWIIFPEDPRNFSLQFTNKQTPVDDGNCFPCSGWKKTKVGDKTVTLYQNKFPIKSCVKLVRKIMTDYLDYEFEKPTADLNNTERVKFLRSGEGAYYTDIDGMVLEIAKTPGQPMGDILLDTNKIGTVSIGQPKSFGIFTAQIDLVGEIPEGVTAPQVQTQIWNMLCPTGRTVGYFGEGEEEFGVKPNFKKAKKGKKQFAKA